MVQIYNGVSLSHKKNEIMPFARLGDYHTEWRKLERERQMLYDTTYVESKNVIKINLFLKHKQSHRLQKQTYVTKGDSEVER